MLSANPVPLGPLNSETLLNCFLMSWTLNSLCLNCSILYYCPQPGSQVHRTEWRLFLELSVLAEHQTRARRKGEKKSSFPPAFLCGINTQNLPLTGFLMRQFFQYYFYLGRCCEAQFLGINFLFSRSCFETVAESRLTTLVERFHKSFHKPQGFPLSFVVILVFRGRSFSHGIFGDCDYNCKTLSFNIVGLYFCSF